MASFPSSSNGDNDSYVFDVFINHRGPDVKRTLATDLHRGLCKHKLRVFLDDQELQEGENITPQIKSAIRTSSVHIAIFSPGYADSQWCLDELVLMVESMHKSGSTIIPVFYGVKPSELRWVRTNNGVYSQSLCVLEEKKKSDGQPRYESNTLEEWRTALSEVAEIKGFDRGTYNGVKTGVLQCLEWVFELCNLPFAFRAKHFMEDIIEGVLKKVEKKLHVSQHPIGLEEKVQAFVTKVSLQQQTEQIKVIGIVGLGGVGKTTLAKEFFNRQRSNYKRSSILFDVRGKDLPTLQNDLIKDLVQPKEQIVIRSAEEGNGMLRRYLSSSEALIILDNVDHIEQLNALLLPAKDVLSTSSLILLTSRNTDVLRESGIPESSIYELTCLSLLHSNKLFCWHAFGQSHPPVGFEKVVGEFLVFCQGLPLSLKVLGALLRGRENLNHWEAQLRTISKRLPNNIKSTLQISYDDLNEEEQQMFLDIACFFIGKDKDTAINTWDGSGWEGELVLWKLKERCLVEVDSKNQLGMHDHLKDLGRYLAEKDSHKYGLRLSQPTDNFPWNLSGQSRVRGISLDDGNEPEEFLNILGSCNLRTLQLLSAEGDFVERIFMDGQFRQLIYLRWSKCPSFSLPSSIPLKNLRVLNLEGAHLETLWPDESQVPLQLREMHIDAPISKVPKSIGKIKHLQKFILRSNSVKSLPDEFHYMPSLKHMELQCRELTLLPYSVGSLTNLQSLDLSCCSALQALPDAVGGLKSLQILDLDGCHALQALPDGVGGLKSLQILDLSRCHALQALPDAVGGLERLQILDLSGCHALQALPDGVGGLNDTGREEPQQINNLLCE